MFHKHVLPIPPQRVLAIAVAAQVAPATVKKVLVGASTRPMGRERVESALRAAGLERLILGDRHAPR